MHGQVVQKDAAPETVAAVRESLRRELAVRMKEAASAQALAQARVQAEAHAHSQLEALLAEKAAGVYVGFFRDNYAMQDNINRCCLTYKVCKLVTTLSSCISPADVCYAPSCNATTEVLHSIACMGYGQAHLCKEEGFGEEMQGLLRQQHILFSLGRYSICYHFLKASLSSSTAAS